MSGEWAASALDWWREAGVDTILDEAPRDWLNPRPAAAAPAAAAAEPKAQLPATLEAFQEWLLTSDALPGAAPSARRIGPAGDGSAGLMVMTDMPADADVAEGRLVSSGGMFDRMLEAASAKSGIPLARETLYLASLSPLRPPAGKLDPRSVDRLAEIARHHIGLVAPKAVLLLGDACSRALLGGSIAQKRGEWHEIATDSGPVRALATMKPEQLVLQPNLKKHAWEDLQMLMEGLKP